MKSERILILPKGQYSATTAYTVLDMVEYLGKMYYCIKDNTGVAPTNTEYWKEFISYVSPFRLGVDNSKYGYYGSDGVFHEFGGTTTAIDVTMTPTSVIPTSNVQSALDYISGTDSTDIATITTNSTGGTNASVRVVHPSGLVDEILSYKSCLNTYKNYSFFAVQYNSSIFSWQVKALSQIKSNGVLYGAGDIVASWGYNVTKSLSIANMANAKTLFVKTENGKSLVADTEIARLATLHNYDDTAITAQISGKADAEHTHTVVDITDFPSSLPASDVYEWAKQENKPSYTSNEIGLGNVDNTSDLSKPISTAMQTALDTKVDKVSGKSLILDSEITRLASVHNYDDTAIRNEVSTKISSIPCTDYSSIDAPTYIDIDERIDKLNDDLSYKEGVKLVPADFETVLGYYSKNTFHEGQKSWLCRLLRVSVNEGEKYKYYTYTDNIYVINYLDSDLNVVKQDTATKNVELEIDVVVPSGVSYIDFYTANFYYKSYVLKYDNSESLYKEEGHIYIDATSDFTVTYGKFFIPNRTSYVDGYKMILKSVTTSKDTLYRFSFAQHQVYSAYVDDCCIAPHITYVDGTEVFRENIVVYVPQGKTLRINDYDSSTYTSKIEKLVGLTEQVILELISKMM